MLLKFSVFVLFFLESGVIRALQLTRFLHQLRACTVDRLLESPPRHVVGGGASKAVRESGEAILVAVPCIRTVEVLTRHQSQVTVKGYPSHFHSLSSLHLILRPYPVSTGLAVFGWFNTSRQTIVLLFSF